MTGQTPPGDSDLKSRLAAVLPSGKTFHIHHVSTPPTKCDALCSPPPGQRPDRTYCEKHFLAVSIDRSAEPTPDKSNNNRVLILGLEIFIFTTAHATTIFVSKADSTGYLHLLNLPAGTPSPIRQICATFVSFLVDKRRRPDGVQLVISLFARAQSQYLFPGSADNSGKHVLDDRGLVKWWCRVLDPLLGETVGGYLVVPGLDAYETRAFTPRSSASSRSRWTTNGHPLEKISHYTREFDWVPPRCLIPSYPDDPKSRFSDELDDEATKTRQFRTTGSWKSVRTLDTFWEMMAFRQECSSGRLTGFIWVVYDDRKDDEAKKQLEPPQTPKKQQKQLVNVTPSTTPRKLFPTAKDKDEGEPKKETGKKPKSKKSKEKKKKLRGPIVARQPRIKTAQRNYLLDRPAHTPYYSWDPAGRGDRILSDTDYKRMSELLLHLDFSSIDKAAGSTRRWISEVALGSAWGYTLQGEAVAPQQQTSAASSADGQKQVNNLTGLVKRKRAESSTPAAPAEPQVLSAGLVRKKPKADGA